MMFTTITQLSSIAFSASYPANVATRYQLSAPHPQQVIIASGSPSTEVSQ